MNTDPSIEEEFLRLIRTNRPRILRICRAYARQEAEDLYQEVLFQIWRGLPGVRERAHADTWIYRVAINTGISFVRKSTRSRPKVIPFEDAGTLTRTPIDKDPRLDDLHAAIEKLSLAERGIVTLYLEDLTYAQIADVMGMNANQVGVMLHRTKKKLFGLMREVVV